MAAVYTLNIEAGATFNRQFEYKTKTGELFDLTGYTALMHIRETPQAELALAVIPTIDVATSTVSIEIDAYDTATLTQPTYVYAIRLTHSSGAPVIRFIQGKAIVSPEVVRD